MEALTDDERQRLAMEPTIGTIFYCPMHQRIINVYSDKVRFEGIVQRKKPLGDFKITST
jgi:hypothetical protein